MQAVVPRPHPVARWVRTVLPWAGVALLPIVVLLAATAGGGPALALPSPDGTVPGIPIRYLAPALVVLLPAGLLRRRPLLALALMLLGASVVTATTTAWEDGYLAGIWYLQFLVVDLMLGLVVARTPRRVSVPTAGVVLAVQVAASFVNLARDPVDRATISVLAVAVAWVAGSSARARRRHAEELRAHATVEAISAERLRIARELHDVVAHSIGVIAIQAGVGARVIDSQPGEARAALATIERTSRETLTGLRRTLGALRRPEEAAASLEPTPGLADLDRLVAAAADAGVRVDVRRDGTPRPLPVEVDLTAYRIVQEALTNVVRHAAVGECRVTVRYPPDGVCVEVVDAGRGAPLGGEGHGIVGMRERTTLLGGWFAAGPRPEGGFRIAVRLPAEAETQA
ncbi:sensor histidine kinase [Micromonospora halophytica]|uniref:histidine kinase n=1 Tax=Micromonospora halophytica TaxID=47864 RepID=A0A1C5GW11_9ACTN|nr:sensor histidine kinase [Micromonospora halophytica]SCG37767.1 Signal transduction histidine kinase [Micromonospora halophytica]